MKKLYFILIAICCSFSLVAQQSAQKKISETYRMYNNILPQEKMYVHTDRTLYKPGENIWFKAYPTNADNTTSTQSPVVYAELINPRGSVERKLTLVRQNGVFKGDFNINQNAPGGIYKIKVFTNWMKNSEDPHFEKEITVQGVVLPRLLMKLDFEKDAYGPDDQVTAELDLRSLDDSPLRRKNFEAAIQLGGQSWKTVKGETDGEGHADIKFRLPDELVTNDGLLNVMISHEGTTESISRSIPIVLNNIDVQFFPEGGDMVMGIENKLGFKALDEFGKAADVSGVVLNGRGETVAKFES